ncbi:hypothetical protein [uncultured Shewanella sp.]|uniref:hypothetical protein n=1 Tax=uncultured Shewanella sp. TaxID=173975 RepID=UPI00262E9E06|nr:hypothetical protein [uncultured Shewanella sp.]
MTYFELIIAVVILLLLYGCAYYMGRYLTALVIDCYWVYRYPCIGFGVIHQPSHKSQLGILAFIHRPQKVAVFNCRGGLVYGYTFIAKRAAKKAEANKAEQAEVFHGG